MVKALGNCSPGALGLPKVEDCWCRDTRVSEQAEVTVFYDLVLPALVPRETRWIASLVCLLAERLGKWFLACPHLLEVLSTTLSLWVTWQEELGLAEPSRGKEHDPLPPVPFAVEEWDCGVPPSHHSMKSRGCSFSDLDTALSRQRGWTRMKRENQPLLCLLPCFPAWTKSKSEYGWGWGDLGPLARHTYFLIFSSLLFCYYLFDWSSTSQLLFFQNKTGSVKNFKVVSKMPLELQKCLYDTFQLSCILPRCSIKAA